MNNVIIYGVSDFSKLIKFYIDYDTNWNIVGFCCDKEFKTMDTFCGIPVFSYEDLNNLNIDFKIVVAIGYSQMNDLRKKIILKCISDGYAITNYIHSTVINYSQSIGIGNIILENSILGPFSKIGDGNLIWNGVIISHDVEIKNFNMLGGNLSLCGYVKIENNCFLGNSCCIKEHINIDSYALVGAKCYINKDVKSNEVYKCQNAILLNKKSKEFY